VYNRLPANTIPRRVLAVAGNEAAMRADVKILRTLGAREITCLNEASGIVGFLEKQHALEIEALRRQGKTVDAKRVVNAVDLVLCDEQPAGTSATAILHEIFTRPALRTQPYLILCPTAAGAARLRAAGLHVLERPYSPDGMCDAVRKAMSPLRRLSRPEDFPALAAGPARTLPGAARSGPGDPVGNAAALPSSPKRRRPAAARNHDGMPTTTELFNRGLGSLKDGDADGAERCFLEVLRRQREHAGAALGMARLCRARNDGEGTRKWLVRAAAAVRRDNGRRSGGTISPAIPGPSGMKAGGVLEEERMENIADMLPVGIRDNIFLHEAVGYMLDGAFREAAQSFIDAEKVAGDAPLHRLVARGCLLTGRPEENMRRVCDALLKMGRREEAPALRRRLLDYTPWSTRRDARPPRFPLLAEALRVASFAVWAWKRA
jgi:hypothetical protein